MTQFIDRKLGAFFRDKIRPHFDEWGDLVSAICFTCKFSEEREINLSSERFKHPNHELSKKKRIVERKICGVLLQAVLRTTFTNKKVHESTEFSRLPYVILFLFITHVFYFSLNENEGNENKKSIYKCGFCRFE